MTDRESEFSPDWVSAPGDTIIDVLNERGWTQSEFAERAGFTTKHVSLLINGKASVTEETALKLERVLGSTARFWLAREAQYREALVRAEELTRLDKQANWLDELPIRDMIRFGWIIKRTSNGAMVAECLGYFGVASVDAWRSRYGSPVAAFRASRKANMHHGAVAAWLRQGERQAQEIKCQPFDKAAFRGRFEALRSLTKESNPDVFVPKLVETCASLGVAVVLVPAPKGCPVSGAAKWLSPDKALLMLSLRHKSNDHLWFSFFHEIGHIELHGKRMTFIDTDKSPDDAREQEADRFASNLLIPPYRASELEFLDKTGNSVRAIASSIGVAPGIVVGRMQKEGYLPWTHLNSLKVRYTWN